MNTTTVNFRLSCEILRNFVVQNTPLGEIPLFCRSDNRFYRTRTAFTRILLEKVTFFLFIRKIGRFKYKSGDREICQEIGSLPIKSGGLEPLGYFYHIVKIFCRKIEMYKLMKYSSHQAPRLCIWHLIKFSQTILDLSQSFYSLVRQ